MNIIRITIRSKQILAKLRYLLGFFNLKNGSLLTVLQKEWEIQTWLYNDLSFCFLYNINKITGILDSTRHIHRVWINSIGLSYILSGGMKPTTTHKIVPAIPVIQTMLIPTLPPGIWKSSVFLRADWALHPNAPWCIYPYIGHSNLSTKGRI